jgi:hypothetical protein
MQNSSLIDTPFSLFQDIDLIALHSGCSDDQGEKLAITKESIIRVLEDFLKVKEIADDRIKVIDGFLFIFNGSDFAQWHTLDWWDQRKRILEMKDHQQYRERATTLLARSFLSLHLDYSDKEVAKSNDQEVKRAWMRKRLVLKESFWNAIDSVSHAAYFQKKYLEFFPAHCVLLCNVLDNKERETELVLGIDNGIGFVYKKKSRESAMIRLFYKMFKFFIRTGVFYIGGLELGLLETESELSCHGSGAVVYQGW